MTLNELFFRRVQQTPKKTLFTFLKDGEEVAGRLTFEELDRQARAIAAQLCACSEEGDRVLLLYEPGLDYITTFFACLYSGRIAVPVYPPNPRMLEQTLPRLMHIVADASPTAVATTSMIRGLAEPLFGSLGFEGLKWCATDEADDLGGSFTENLIVGPEAVAFLQYTSGSTANPRGVRVTHGNLVHNVRTIAKALRADETTVGVSWLPLYHDMGLIGKVITPALTGCSAVLMSPLDYLRRPARWLQAISRFGGTVSAAPNFAFDLCVRKVTDEELSKLDLSTWDVALNGAEPVLAETLENFARRFGPAGFRREAFLPAYGLAESTLMVTGASNGARPFVVRNSSLEQGRIELENAPDETDKTRTLVSSGSVPIDNHIVRIVGPESRVALRDGAVGEIWVSGPSIADGYWGNPEGSSTTFGERLSEDDGREYLRTGDLGFMIEGELVVTGRQKDLMILRGRNIYPQDVENTVAKAHEAVRPGGMAAFSVDAPGGEVAVVVAELERRTTSGKAGDDRRETETLPDHEVSAAPKTSDVAGAIRRAVLQEHQVDIAHVILIKPGSVPKTSSGKIQRHECRRQFLSGELDEVGRLSREEAIAHEPVPEPWISPEDLLVLSRDERLEMLANYLTDLVAHVTGTTRAQVAETSLMSVGLDSLKAMELQYTIEERLGVRLFPSLLLGGATIEEIARELVDADLHRMMEEGLNDVSSEVFLEPEGGRLTESIRFELFGGRGGDLRDPLSFVEDPHPGPVATIEFRVDDLVDSDLSWNEKGFWLYQKAKPESWATNLYYASKLPQDIGFSEVRAAARRLLGRHENLRSRYNTLAGAPVRTYVESSEPDFETVDARSWTEEQLKEDFLLQTRQPVDLRVGPPVWFRFYEREDRCVLYMGIHHIVADFWSLERLARELRDHITGTADIDPLGVTYADFVEWQRKLLESGRGQWCENFWREELSRGVPRLEFPTVSSTSNANSAGYGASHRTQLSLEVIEAIDKLAEDNHTTRYTVLLAAYQALLFRWTGQPEFLVGVVTAGRTRRFFREVVGMFANPLPIRSKWTASTTFEDHLAATRESLLKAMDAQEFPLQAMLERFDLRRDSLANPLIQTLFASEQPREGGLELGADIDGFETLDLGLAGTAFDLTVMVHHAKDGGEIRIQYDDTKFHKAQIAWLGDAYCYLLQRAVRRPQTKIAQIALLGADEELRITNEWGSGDWLSSGSTVVHRLFEARVEASPHAVALQAGDERWTFGELNEKANRYARWFVQSGVGLEDAVGVAMRRSPERVAVLLGVLKAGGAYVPIDPDFAAEHIKHVLERADVDLVVCDDEVVGEFPARAGTALVSGADLQRGAQNLAAADLSEIQVSEDGLMMILFTSGSTGQPKGVMMRHETISNLLDWKQAAYPLGIGEAVLQKTPFTFDVSAWEIFAPLAYGGRLILCDHGAHREPRVMCDAIQRFGVTHLQVVPTQLQGLTELPDFSKCTTLRHIISAGEALTPELRDETKRSLTSAKLHNMYGPTETYYATYWDCGVGEKEVPIGYPLSGYRLHVLDDHLNVVGRHQPAQLYVGGVGVARGYASAPRLTALRFLPNPVEGAPLGDRVYRTGDLVRWGELEELHFLGRADRQIKLRGNRIELEAIEVALESHPALQRAAVVPVKAADGVRYERLIAFYTTTSASIPADFDEQLRQHVGGQLPQYAVPGQFRRLDEFPQTSSGKIDRTALSTDAFDRTGDKERTAPRTETERALVEIWQRYLGVDQIGVFENFFGLGGHSLLAVRIQHDVASAMGVEVALDAMFAAPTVAQMAAYIDSNSAQAPTALATRGSGDEAPLSAEQRQMWILQALNPNAVTYQSPGVFRVRGELDLDSFQRALTRLVERHEILRTIYPLQDDEVVQKILPAPEQIELVVEDLRDDEDPELEASQLVNEAVAEPFDLAVDTSLRVSLYRIAADEWVLCLLFHHVAIDEWSIDVLFEELSQLYAAERRTRATAEAEERRLDDWQTTFGVAYRGLTKEEGENLMFRTEGWLSSYTGQAYASEEMAEWLTGSLAPLRDLELGRTLEIGCGTGMILFELAPKADEYVGLDFSKTALKYIDSVRNHVDRDLSRVELVHGRADELDRVEGTFDTIIINSVAQYFPDFEYFERVVRAACERLNPSGTLYLGDLRDRRSAYAFHASVQKFRADEDLSRDELRVRTGERLMQDDELLLTPEELAHLSRGLPNISHIEFTYPRAQHMTEMSRFRFGALLRAEENPDLVAPDDLVDWSASLGSMEALRDKLSNLSGSVLISGVPNQRVTEAVELGFWLAGDDGEARLATFAAQTEGFDPDAFLDVGEQLGLRASVLPSGDALGLCFDALFEMAPVDEKVSRRIVTPLTARGARMPLPTLATTAAAELQGVTPHGFWSYLVQDQWVRRQAGLVSDDTFSAEAPSVQYADYAIWQHGEFRTDAYQIGIRYWKQALEGLTEGLAWPVGREPEGREHPAEYVQHTWSAALSESVTEFARSRSTSEFVVLYALFTQFLGYFSGQYDVTVGVGTTMRKRPEFSDLVGYLLNMLPMRMQMAPDASFNELLAQSEQRWSGSRPHDWIPLEQIVEALGVKRRPGQLPLYDVMFTYVPRNLLRRSSADLGEFEDFADLQFRPFDYGGVPNALCSLFVSMFRNDGRIGVELEYDAARFDRRDVEHMAKLFEWTAQQALRAPDANGLPEDGFTSASQVGAWTRGPEVEFSDAPIHQQFEARVAADPHGVALRFEGGEWTFEQLNRRSNRIANHLVSLGVTRGMRIGVNLQRTPELIAALLGVMKAGGAYVALEPDLPASRLTYIASDSNCEFMVTDLADDPSIASLARVVVDINATEDAALSTENPGVTVDSDDLIYVLYTSGTTGLPKGVMVPHSAVSNHVQWLVSACGVTDADTFLLKSAYGFDMSVSELFGPLATGGTMAIAKPGGQRDPAYLIDAARRFGVTCLRVVPTTLNLILTEPSAGELEGTLRWVMLGGEALTPEVRDRFFDTYQTAELHNPFGITETCVDVTFWSCPRERRGQEVSLGTPMGNYQVYVLDASGDPVSDHVVGEMFVGGAGVSYGYWGKAKRTATVFVPDPFSSVPGARLYASGDHGRWDDNHELRYGGRRDDQVQLFGVRVELGEVEAFLERVPGVLQGAVRAVGHADGRAEGLIAYIVPEAGQTVAPGEIREHLSAHLRREVIPTQFVFLAEMPRKPSGKIDRSALPEPEIEVGDEPVGQRSGTEEKILGIWKDVLGVERVGLDSNFFEVGGTSLKAIQVYRRLQQAFDREFEVVELFEHTTVRKLSVFLDDSTPAPEKEAAEGQERAERGRRRRESVVRQRSKRGRRPSD